MVLVKVPSYKVSAFVTFNVTVQESISYNPIGYFCHFSTICAFANQLLSFQLVQPTTLPFPKNEIDTEKTSNSIEKLRQEIDYWFSSQTYCCTTGEVREILTVLYRKQSQREQNDGSLVQDRSFSLGDLSFLRAMISLKEKTKPRRKRKSHNIGIRLSKEELQSLQGIEPLPERKGKQIRKLSKSTSYVSASIAPKKIISSDEPETESDDEEGIDASKVLAEENLLNSCMEKLQSGSSLGHITETILQQILTHTKSQHAYLIRASLSGKLFCEAELSSSQARAWNILKKVPISKLEIPCVNALLKCRQTMNPVFLSDPMTLHQRDGIVSVGCIPLVQQRKFQGALYLSSTALDTFDHLNISLLSSLSSNVLCMIENSILKTKLVRKKMQQLVSPKAKCIPSALLQDTVRSFDGECWEKIFLVLTDKELLHFASSHDTTPCRRIPIQDIKSFQTIYNRSEAEELLQKVYSSAMLGPFHSFHSLIFIHSENGYAFFVMNCREFANSWAQTLEKVGAPVNS